MSNNSIYFNTLKKYENEIALNEFGRGKDKQKRKNKGMGTAGKVGLGVAGAGTVGVGGVYGGNVLGRANKAYKAEKGVVEKGSKTAENLRKNANDAFSRSNANKATQTAAKNADDFISKGGIGKRSMGIVKGDAKQVASKVAGKVGGAKSFLVGAAKKLLRK